MEEKILDLEGKKKKTKWQISLHIVSNVMFVIVMFILAIFLAYGIGSVKNNKVPSFFGKSYVRILTGSMTASGFNQGDVVMIKKTKLSEIKEGDIIAFYSGSPGTSPSLLKDENVLNDFETGEKSFNSSIIFHKIGDTGVDSKGNFWVRTYGTSNTDGNGNPSYDGWTRGDYIVGVYEPSFFAGVIQFISSTTGIIVVVIIPCCLVLFLLMINIIEIIDKMLKEKKEKQAKALENIEKANVENGKNQEENQDKTQEEKQVNIDEINQDQQDVEKESKEKIEEKPKKTPKKQKNIEKSQDKIESDIITKKEKQTNKEDIMKQVDELVEKSKTKKRKHSDDEMK